MKKGKTINMRVSEFTSCRGCDKYFYTFEIKNIFGINLCCDCAKDFFNDYPEFKNMTDIMNKWLEIQNIYKKDENKND